MTSISEKIAELERDYMNTIKELDTHIDKSSNCIYNLKDVLKYTDDTTPIPDNIQSYEEYVDKCNKKIIRVQQKIKDYKAEKTATTKQYKKKHKELEEQQQKNIFLTTTNTFIKEYCIQDNIKSKERVSSIYEKYINYCLCNNIISDNYSPFKKNLFKHFKPYRSNGYITIRAICKYKIVSSDEQ